MRRPGGAAHAHQLSPDKEPFDVAAPLLSELGELMGCSAQALQSIRQHARSFIAVSYYNCNCCYYYCYYYLLLRTPAKTYKPFFSAFLNARTYFVSCESVGTHVGKPQPTLPVCQCGGVHRRLFGMNWARHVGGCVCASIILTVIS